jgi:membrane protease YdiL (CAAX protease family)
LVAALGRAAYNGRDRAKSRRIAVSEQVERTYRWRRRQVVQTRLTWLGLVAVLLLLIHKEILRTQPALGMTGKAAWFIAVVLVPMGLLLLWRAGLLPPERVPVDLPAEPDAGAAEPERP